jgi:thiol peroxidase
MEAHEGWVQGDPAGGHREEGASMEERLGATTFVEEPLTLIGREIEVGDTAADFGVLTPALETYSLDDGRGEVRLVAAVPSLDTPVCDSEILRLSQEAQTLENIRVLVVSADLPFAQERWRRERGVDNATFLSDHRDLSFGKAFGIAIKELRLLGRAIFVIDPENRVRYVQYVRELTEHPDYEAALDAAREVSRR